MRTLQNCYVCYVERVASEPAAEALGRAFLMDANPENPETRLRRLGRLDLGEFGRLWVWDFKSMRMQENWFGGRLPSILEQRNCYNGGCVLH